VGHRQSPVGIVVAGTVVVVLVVVLVVVELLLVEVVAGTVVVGAAVGWLALPVATQTSGAVSMASHARVRRCFIRFP
jgi:hypothetical protein